MLNLRSYGKFKTLSEKTDCTNVHPQLTLNVLRSGQTLPWTSIQQQSQETVLQTGYNAQSTVQQLVLNSQGNIQPSAQNGFAVHVLNPTLTQAEPQQPISANELVLPINLEIQGCTPTIVPDEWVKRTELQVPTNILSIPSVAGVNDQIIYLPTQTIHGVSSNCYNEGAYSPLVTPTPNMATTGLSADYPQRCSANQLESWSLNPKSVPTFVAPMEAQTKTKTRKTKKRTPKNVSQGQYASLDKQLTSNSSKAKVSRNLDKMEARSMQQTPGKQMEATVQQTQSQNSAPSSVTQKSGKKGVKRIVIPPKVQTDSVEYPPYVARIMRILNRQKQGQVESTDDKKESVDSTSKQMSTAGRNAKDRADSTLKEATTADKKAKDTVNSDLKQKEPQSVVSRSPVPSKQSAQEQKLQHKSLSNSAVQKVNERCSQLNSGSKKEPMSIRKTLPEDYRPVVNTSLLLEDLSPGSFSLLEADNFYGQEILVTSGSHCFVASVPFF
ncbi:uncharacterized protein LOC133204754 [Saccostrea echinata]|uniref:uncharacterized protein LOC133204754 n=1 Tax=Saccostrea echinata TaxID=191078 RepID=UPI002A83EF5F|nr:uncharacterized protein LOC133204754 [Saccostrea echinata]